MASLALFSGSFFFLGCQTLGWKRASLFRFHSIFFFFFLVFTVHQTFEKRAASFEHNRLTPFFAGFLSTSYSPCSNCQLRFSYRGWRLPRNSLPFLLFLSILFPVFAVPRLAVPFLRLILGVSPHHFFRAKGFAPVRDQTDFFYLDLGTVAFIHTLPTCYKKVSGYRFSPLLFRRFCSVGGHIFVQNLFLLAGIPPCCPLC